MKTKIKIIEVADISVIWKDWVYSFKMIAHKYGKQNAAEAAKYLSIGNMYTYRNLIDFEGKIIKYPTQTIDAIKNHWDIIFLN